MAVRDGSALNVQSFDGRLNLTRPSQWHTGKRFVDFEGIDLVHGQPRHRQRLPGSRYRTCEHKLGITPDHGTNDDARPFAKTEFVGLPAACQQHCCRAVRNLARINRSDHTVRTEYWFEHAHLGEIWMLADTLVTPATC